MQRHQPPHARDRRRRVLTPDDPSETERDRRADVVELSRGNDHDQGLSPPEEPGGTVARLQLLHGRVPQQQSLDTLVAEVDLRDTAVARALDLDDGAEAERVVGDAVAGFQVDDVPGPGELTPGREASRATAGWDDGWTAVDSERRQSTSSGGISPTNRLAGA